MALTHDGVQTPLPPNLQGLGLGVLVLVGGVVACFTPGMICLGIPAILIGVLMVLNQVRGTIRTRVTFSKLLVEEERFVMGFLVGPSKRRLTWSDFDSAEVAEGEVVVKGKSGAELRVGKGCPDSELASLKEKIEDAAERYQEEGGV